jgi:hypothetical protein
MTSALILPDITLHGTAARTQEPIELSEAAQRVLDEVAQHKRKNCSVCKRICNDSSIHHHSNSSWQDSIKIPKPVPVSDRIPETSICNEEPTLRPSQPPALALATVLKGLEDELSHLKMQLAVYQTAYSKHDASLGKKERKSIYRKIESLLVDIDTKSDQIYALYDVLEGQKQDGHEMTQQEVEVTLQSMGIDVTSGRDADLTDRLGRDDTKRPKVAAEDDELDESYNDELPWEGIESTVELTGKSFTSRRRVRHS